MVCFGIFCAGREHFAAQPSSGSQPSMSEVHRFLFHMLLMFEQYFLEDICSCKQCEGFSPFKTVSCYLLQVLTNNGCPMFCYHHLPLEIHLTSRQLGNKPNWGNCSCQRQQHVKVQTHTHTLNKIDVLLATAFLRSTLAGISFLWRWLVDTLMCDCVRVWQESDNGK